MSGAGGVNRLNEGKPNRYIVAGIYILVTEIN